MNIQDIEKAIQELSSRHPNIDEGMLDLLFRASGWDDRYIQEAKTIFRLNQKNLLEDNHFKYQESIPKDNTIKHEALRNESSSISKDLQQNDASYSSIEDKKEVATFLRHEDVAFGEDDNTKKEESLVSETAFKEPKWLPPPDDLPLVPFESAPHVWSFARYKNTFHQDGELVVGAQENKEPLTKETPKEEIPSFAPYVPVRQDPPVETLVDQEHYLSTRTTLEEHQVDFEKTPISTGDQSLVILASTMLLAILLILGYMYSNGRL